MDREEAGKKLKDILEEATAYDEAVSYVTSADAEAIKTAIETLKAQEWIPVKWHYITDEEREREGYPKDWAVCFDCEMPEDEQAILVTTRRGYVEKDICYEYGMYLLDSGWDWIEDIIAWMPSPEPYKAESEE